MKIIHADVEWYLGYIVKLNKQVTESTLFLKFYMWVYKDLEEYSPKYLYWLSMTEEWEWWRGRNRPFYVCT